MTSPAGIRSVRRARTRTVPATGGGQITRTVLPGGLRIITEAMPGVRSVSVGVWVPVGSRDETPAVAGASHFLEHLLFKGTTSRTALDIASAMDAVGGEFNAFTEKEHTCYYATVLDRDLPLAIDIVTDVVLNATVTSADVDVERSVVLEEIAMRDDDPADLVHDEFASALFGDTPLGRPILGTVESIGGLSRRADAGYYRRSYPPTGMVVSVAGNVDHRRRGSAGYGGLRAAGSTQRSTYRRDAAISEPRARPRRVTVIEDDTEQANIVLGMPQHFPARRAQVRGRRVVRRPRRRDEFAAVPAHPRRARPGVFGVHVRAAATPTPGSSVCTRAANRARPTKYWA